MTRPPTIGITVSLDPGTRIRPGTEYLYVGRAYVRAVRDAGALPLLVPPDADVAQVVRVCDGFVVTGGAMLPTSLSGGVVAPASVGETEQRERVLWDRQLLDCARAQRRPLLGVCYGMQLLNLHAGGTLHTDLAGAVKKPLDHGGNGRICEHAVETAADSALRAILGAHARVASSHRQAVDRVAAGFRVAAAAPDGVIEAIEAEDGAAVLGVEWHPESDATGRAVYGWLVRRIEERA
ncbi:MAG: gamma-glutamyl-gamma-aminobutyrate hydrolase family protein [Proteobacteria bacterium]|nr:gamma-glutamyl-gamma-aminobutyrate hydrolase family protein [Pseudomonadota bacterium]